jgi:hypothetical protein
MDANVYRRKKLEERIAADVADIESFLNMAEAHRIMADRAEEELKNIPGGIPPTNE